MQGSYARSRRNFRYDKLLAGKTASNYYDARVIAHYHEALHSNECNGGGIKCSVGQGI